MDIDVFSQGELPSVFRALRTALAGAAPLDARQRGFLSAYARITGFELPHDDPTPIGAQAVRIEGRHQRKRLIQLAALAVLLDRPIRGDSVAYLRNLARHLGTHDPVIDAIDAVHAGRLLEARVLSARRGFRVFLKEAYLAEGPKGVMRFLGAMVLKAPVNKDKLWNYKRLGLLPDGTLGREYWKHMTRVGFAFPGEPSGIPDSIAYHDIIHVLAEHPTTPLGEIQQGAFQAGSRREDGFFFVQMVVLHFHQGVPITPATPPTVDLFDPGLVLWALHRGANSSVDMTHQWDFWPLMPLPLPEARARCAVLPKLPAAQIVLEAAA
jgi:hypothetical protein